MEKKEITEKIDLSKLEIVNMQGLDKDKVYFIRLKLNSKKYPRQAILEAKQRLIEVFKNAGIKVVVALVDETCTVDIAELSDIQLSCTIKL